MGALRQVLNALSMTGPHLKNMSTLAASLILRERVEALKEGLEGKNGSSDQPRVQGTSSFLEICIETPMLGIS